jgi:hypothetical protein
VIDLVAHASGTSPEAPVKPQKELIAMRSLVTNR